MPQGDEGGGDEEEEDEEDGPWRSRILCLTVRRAKGPPGQSLFRPFLSMIRSSEDEESGYEVSHTYALKQIKDIKVPIAKQHHERNGVKLRPLDFHIAGQAQKAGGGAINHGAFRPSGGLLGREEESTLLELGLEGEGEGLQMMVLSLISELLRQEGGAVQRRSL